MRRASDGGRHPTGRRANDEDERSAPLRLLFAVPFSPRRDAHHGGGRVIAQLLLRLAEHHTVAVVYLRRPGSPPMEAELARRCSLVEEIAIRDRGPCVAAWRRRLLVLSSPLSGMPSAVALLRDRSFARAVLNAAISWQPDVIEVEHDNLASLGPILRKSGSTAARVLTCHEPGALASKDQARATHGRRRFAHLLDAAGWQRYWSRTLSSFDAVVTLTENDRSIVEAAGATNRVLSIGLGIDIPDEPLSATGHDEPNVLYFGGYKHPPNTDAALRLMRTIMPKVRRRVPGVNLRIVGADPGPGITDAASSDDTVTGTVPNMTPFLDQASLVVLPIRLGGGMRVKLLEALAAGKAVVASPLAAAGLDANDGEELIMAETDDEFAEAIVALLADQDARSRIGRNARAWALQNLSWDAAVTDYERLYRSLAGAG